MPSLISDVRKSVNEYKSELFSLKAMALSVKKSVCDVDDVISSIQTSTQIQDEKIDSLEEFQRNSEVFIEEVVRIDREVADVVNQNKEKFYEEYSYLTPDSERSDWENFCQDVGEWCQEHWEEIVVTVTIVVGVVAIIAISIATFRAAAVGAAALVGGVVGITGQLTSDVISWTITGEWDGNWQSYVGAAMGGAFGGVLSLTGNLVISCAADATISTFFGQNLENITGGTKRTSTEIWKNTIKNAGIAALLGRGFDKIGNKSLKSLATAFPSLSRLSGRGSYSAAFQMVLTKLANGQIKKITYKTIRNGIVSGVAGDAVKNITGGMYDGISELFTRKKLLLQN